MAQTNTAPVQPKKLRIAQALELYPVSRSTLYRAFDSGELTRIKRGRIVMIDAAELEAWASGE